jgi:hypothetical protein
VFRVRLWILEFGDVGEEEDVGLVLEVGMLFLPLPEVGWREDEGFEFWFEVGFEFEFGVGSRERSFKSCC